MSRPFLIVFCGLLLASNAFSTDVLLPAFYAMHTALDAPIEQVQSTVPIYMMCSAFGQLIHGPSSDRFGRRPIILLGLLLYGAGALLAATAAHIDIVILGRALQGFGAAASVVVARAILRDTHAGDELARTMALAMAMISAGPILAPLAGTGLIALGGWRMPFVAMGLFGAGMAATALWRLTETNVAPNPKALAPSSLFAASKRVLRHPQSRIFLILSSALSCMIISFIAHSPRMLKETFGIEGVTFALVFAGMGFGIIFGQVINNRVITRLGVLTTTRLSAAGLAISCAAMAILAALNWLTPVSFSAMMFIFNTFFLVTLANSGSMVIDPHHDIAGLTSSLLGFVTQLVPSVLTLATLAFFQGSLLRWATVTAILASAVLVALLVYRPRVQVMRDTVPAVR
jgi:MFS transporter, DHA1 family, multidrug resistance protein